MNNNQTLSCPVCQSNITFNTQALLSGASFECQVCQAQIKLSKSSISATKEAYEKFNNLKKKLLQNNEFFKTFEAFYFT